MQHRDVVRTRAHYIARESARASQRGPGTRFPTPVNAFLSEWLQELTPSDTNHMYHTTGCD
jgi:hypothetical protein